MVLQDVRSRQSEDEDHIGVQQMYAAPQRWKAVKIEILRWITVGFFGSNRRIVLGIVKFYGLRNILYFLLYKTHIHI